MMKKFENGRSEWLIVDTNTGEILDSFRLKLAAANGLPKIKEIHRTEIQIMSKKEFNNEFNRKSDKNNKGVK